MNRRNDSICSHRPDPSGVRIGSSHDRNSPERPRPASTPATAQSTSHGIPARLVTKPEEVEDAIKFARETPGPVVLEFHVEKEEAVFPMVPAGAALDQMMRRPVRKEVEKE